MRLKRILSIFICILGILAFVYAVHSMGRITRAKDTAHALTSPFADNPIGRIAGEVAKQETSQYDKKVMALLISGIILCAIGAGMGFYYFYKR